MLKIIFISITMYVCSIGQSWDQYLDNDWRQFKTNVNPNTLLISGGWIAGMYLLSHTDEFLNEEIKSLNKGYFKYYFKTVDHLGHAPYAIPVTIGFAGMSLLTNSNKFRGAALTSLESVAVTALLVYTLKIGMGRKRPYEKQGAFSFEPFSGWDDSFPSGHTSTAFALITPYVYYYKSPLTYALFLFPASTAISRMIYDKHWATDVLSGGIIGFTIGYYLSKWHKDFNNSNKTREMPPLINISIPL